MLHSLISRQNRCQLFINSKYSHSRNVCLLPSVSVLVNCVNRGNLQRINQSSVCQHRAVPITRFLAALHQNANVRPPTLPVHTGRETGLHWFGVKLHSEGSRGYSRSRPNVRWLTLSPKAIVEASPLYIQPYLRLIRLDRPIGMYREIAIKFVFDITLVFFVLLKYFPKSLFHSLHCGCYM